MDGSTGIARPPLVRRVDARIVAGVAAGLADHLGVDRRLVRGAFAIAGLFGVGIVAYAAAVLIVPGSDGTPAPVARLRPRDGLDLLALGAIALGSVLLVNALAPQWPATLIVPVVVALGVLAVFVAWPQGELAPPAELPDWLPPAAATTIGVLQTRRGLLVRVGIGGVLVVGAVGVLLVQTRSWTDLQHALLAMAIASVGLVLVFGPWLGRLGAELASERRDRIRTEERAEMAAHLHDSVLQTLALVQRVADDPREVARLARKQERELRAWLQAGDDAPAATFARVVDAYAAELEDAHGVAVDVVHVRDCPLDHRLHAMALAAREAVVNAQLHAGVDRVSVYTEVDPREVRVYVRDRGRGFDRAAVPADRRGVAESIEGRMQRHGGRASVRSAPGEGTEVELVMPRTESPWGREPHASGSEVDAQP